MDLQCYDSPVGRLGLLAEGDTLTGLILPNQQILSVDVRETLSCGKPASS